MVIATPEAARAGVRTKRIDGDTHFAVPVDYNDLKGVLPKSRHAEAQDMMWRDGLRFANPQGVRDSLGQRVTGGPPATRRGDDRDPVAIVQERIEAMNRLGFDTQVVLTQSAMPSPLRAADKPLWLRAALARLYNDSAAKLQQDYPDRFITHATVPWDDIDESVRELERSHKLGLRTVLIAGSYLDKNLDEYALFPFWEAVNALGFTCLVHDTPQPCGGAILDHTTPYPMLGTERYHRLHIGTYLGFGIDYTMSCAALTLGGVLDEFPNLRFIFMEAGALWMSYAMVGADRSFFIEPACSRTRTRPSELIRRHCLTEIQGMEPVEQIVAAYGSENLFLATDFPHPEFQVLPNSVGGILDREHLSDTDKENILGGNLARVFNRS